METFKIDSTADVNGTHRVGEIETTYAKLRKAFGEPTECDGYKVSGEWTFTDEQGQVFTLYDWKLTSLYDSDLPTVEEFRRKRKPSQFNIGGNCDATNFILWLKGKIG